MKISIVIPVYKKSEMLIRHLKHNLKFIKQHDIIVVDDASDEDIAAKVHALSPDIRVIENAKNMGFGPTVNVGIYNAHGDLIVLLNSDVKLRQPFDEEYLTRLFKKERLFAISFKQIERDNMFVGKNVLGFTAGMPFHSKASDMQSGPNAWADGGSCIIRASYLKQLAGFNEMYSPFYWEDIDLSYRARSRGWKVLFDENIVVEHHHESTIGSLFSKDHVKAIAYRNQLLFTWSNITDEKYFREHIKMLPQHIGKAIVRLDIPFLKGFCMALLKYSAVKRSRAIKLLHAKKTDAELLEA